MVKYLCMFCTCSVHGHVSVRVFHLLYTWYCICACFLLVVYMCMYLCMYFICCIHEAVAVHVLDLW